MMPAAKHGDPQIGVDIHLCVVPPSPSPVPLPTLHTSIVFDPMDYIPFIGATVTVCGMKRATAGTNGKAIHIPPGFPFAPKIPDTSDEIFMGSATVVADGNPFSFLAVPVLSCQVSGMPSPPRPNHEKKLMLLPTVTNLAIPTNVFVGGPPTISLMGMAFKLGFAALGRFAKSGAFKWVRKKLFGWMKSGFLKCVILRAEPVDIVTGEVSVEQQDFALPGRIPIDWVRTYTSNNTRRGACGYGWESPADIRLEVYPQDNSAVFLRPAAAPAPFPELPAACGNDEAILELWDGALLSDHGREFQVRTKEDKIYHFDKALAFTNEDGVQEYPINRISDLCGNWLEFERLGRHPIAINESAGRRIEIEIEDGLIRQVGLLAPTADFRHVFVQYRYDDASNLVAVVDALGSPYTFSYDQHHLIRHTDRNTLSFYYEFDKRGEEWRVVHSWGDGGLYNYRFEYLDELKERRITDSLGNVSLVKLDERGLPISEIDPLFGVTIFEYDEVGRTTAVVDPNRHRTEYEYDERGNLLRLNRPDDTATAIEFDANNRALAIIDGNGAQWIQRWDMRGLLVEQTSPLGNVSRYEYDARGRLVAFVSPRGGRTEFTFDAVGNLVGLRDALGHRTLFAYDALGNFISEADPLDRKTLYTYDAKSRLTEVRLPSGATIRCTYDAEDNLTNYCDENGAETKLEYFGQAEIARRIQPDGHMVEYLYDSQERLIGLRNQRGELYRLRRDALGRIVEEIDYWGQSRRYAYDAGGNLVHSVDPLGRRIDYKTDPLGRIVRKLLPEGLVDEFTYDANGNLIGCGNQNICVERRFDAENRMLEEKQGEAFVIRNSYDAGGNRIQRQAELKQAETTFRHTVEYAYDLLDQAMGVAIDDHPPIKIERDAAGQIIAEQLNPVLRREMEYNGDGYLARQHVHSDTTAVIDIAYGYDAAGNLVERRDAAFGIDRFTYNPVGCITQHLDPRGRLKLYFGDPAGDRLKTRIAEREPRNDVPSGAKAATGIATTHSEGGSRGQRIWSRECEYEGAVYRFDRAGSLAERTTVDGTIEFRWNANEWLTKSRRDGQITTYRYDPLGRRIIKVTPEETICFFWDGDALFGDASFVKNDTPAVSLTWHRLREWVYFPETFLPIMMLQRNTPASGQDPHQLKTDGYFYHNDTNGCPTCLLDRKGKIVWKASYEAFGKTATTNGCRVSNPIRLQGQYYDEENLLCYNRYRYYDPEIGYFISQDPLRIAAGERLYFFGPNIWKWIDPLGLSCKLSEAKKLVARWEKGTFSTLRGSILYHWQKHMPGTDVWTYLRKAAAFNKKGAVRKLVDDGIIRYERKSGEYLMEREGKIVSYGINRL